MTTELTWQQHPVKLTYSRRKTIALHVQNGQIEVRAPEHTSRQFAQSFINTKQDWLEKTLTDQLRMQRDKIDYSFANHIPFMGFNVRIIRHKATKDRWSLIEQGLKCCLRDEENTENTLKLLVDFYQHQAKFWLTKKTLATVSLLGLDHRFSDIRFRNTKTKWGHCTSEGRIQYNWQIMMAPENIIDYLVAHEVSHLRHLNHSAKFWQMVESIHPNYKKDRQWLHDNGHRLTLR